MNLFPRRALSRPSSGFSLFEALAAIAVVGILAWVVIASQSGTPQSVAVTKLESDVITVNQAISVYLANGGSLSGISDPQAVLNKMKTRLSAEDDAKQVGFGGPMIDTRLVARPTTDTEARSSAKRAIWKPSRSRFEIATTGTGVAEFLLDTAEAIADYGNESRLSENSALQFESGNGWIWAYTDTPASPRSSPTIVPLSNPALASNPANPSPAASRTQLQAPAFSQAAGAYPLSRFPLYLSISDPNASCSSWIMVSVNGGSYTEYAGPLSVDQDTRVAAFIAGDPKLYYSSSITNALYSVRPPIVLTAPVITASADQFLWNTTESISVSLENPNDSKVSSLEYQVDGGEWVPYAAPIELSISSHRAGANIAARAVPLSVDYQSSQLSSKTVLSPPASVKLMTPEIALSSSKFDATISTITVTLSNPNPTASSTLFYAVKLPAAGYPPLSDFLPYNGPIIASAAAYPDGFHVQAYAKSLDIHRFLDSAPAEALTTADFFGVPLGGDILFVLDASGSMSARFGNTTRFQRVLDETIQAINSLGSTQKFAVIAFNDRLHWSDGSNDLKLATPENKQAAVSALLSLENVSGTNYEVGLAYAAGLLTKPAQILFLSDGLPNRKNYEDDLATVVNLGIKVNTVGIGNRGSHGPLEELARVSGGTYTYVPEPGSKGTLNPPAFSMDGNTYTYTQYPLALSLTNPNSVSTSRIRYAINGGPLLTYTGPITVGYNTTVEAFVESSDPAWAPSVKVSETYSVNTFVAVRPDMALSASAFTDSVPTVTLTLTDRNPAGLTSLVWWFGSRTESSAVPYTGPVTLSAADWNNFAGEAITQVQIYSRAVSGQSFVVKSTATVQSLENKTTAFLSNLRKTPLKIPVFLPGGNTFSYTQFPLSVTLQNPNGGLGKIYVSTNGGTLALYNGPLSLSYNTIVTAFIKAEGTGVSNFRSSSIVSESYTVTPVTLVKPTIALSALEFTRSVQSITVTLTNPNPPAISRLVYWFEGQDESTATPYTGPFTLLANDWESFVARRRSEAKILVRAVGKYPFAQASAVASVRIRNWN